MSARSLNWLRPFADSWRTTVEQNRVPHAVLLLGRSGLGKRSAAAWLARDFLGLPQDDLPSYPEDRPEHADLRWISPLEGKHVIGVDAIRELVADVALTSYEGHGKVAVVDPADAMTVNAANSLLKTLEEPPGRSLLILVADKLGHLPATIVSRCQRISLSPPAPADGIAWLDRLSPGKDWSRALQDAGGAPLAAIEEAERAEQTASMRRALDDLVQRRASPLDVAAAWSKLDPVFLLGWLAIQVQGCIQRSFGISGARAGSAVGDTVLRGIDRRNLFCYLDTINQLRSQPVGSYNVLLTLEGLLIDWADRLRDHREKGIIR